MNSGSAIGIIPIAQPKFVKAQASNPPHPLIKKGAGVGGFYTRRNL